MFYYYYIYFVVSAMITHVDDGIKQIVDALRRTDQHQRTLIVFMSDVSNIHCGTNPVNIYYLYNVGPTWRWADVV